MHSQSKLVCVKRLGLESSNLIGLRGLFVDNNSTVCNGQFTGGHCLIDFTQERKIVTHTEGSVKRRDPGIQSLARSYNTICAQMKNLLQHRRAPRNAVVPPVINVPNLFNLDAEDEVWEDIGLDDDYPEAPPPWLCEEGVRQGIKAKLQLDRCMEDIRRLIHERRALREWMAEEWASIKFN